ncbi:hypothetical protein FGIG_05929 [Fasciola gigantica]|uniref:Uncharacterized protein n=1 Tax=Fasciola gigantica TaxID=46835 RepID=A0A504Z7J6_FASGI|nr:hypothetical protein FGIG_05929 [Fasciola gigantica]
MPKAIGIDLGFSKCCVAVIKDNDTIIIPVDGDANTTPSVISYTSSKYIFGTVAVRQANLNLRNTISGVKHLIGQKFTSLSGLRDMYRTFSLLNIDNRPYVEIECENHIRRVSPQEIIALMLLDLKNTTEMFLEETVSDVVLTVPAMFTDAQRRATKEAGLVAGFQSVNLLNETTAAALAYGIECTEEFEKKKVVILDLGGGQFCASAIEFDLGVIEVLSVSGSETLGGNTYDESIMTEVLNIFRNIHKEYRQLSFEASALHRLRSECEKAKQKLNYAKKAQIWVNCFVDHIDLDVTVTRERFVEITRPLWNQTVACIEDALQSAALTNTELDEIVLLGGSTNMKIVSDGIHALFPNVPIRIPLNAMTMVACGAAAHAAKLYGMLSDKYSKWEFFDCIPRSIGVRSYDHKIMLVFPRGAVVPNERLITQKTTMDNQTRILVSVYEGEEQMDDKCLLDNIIIQNLEPKPRGAVTVDIKFTLDREGILTAKVDGQNMETSFQFQTQRIGT